MLSTAPSEPAMAGSAVATMVWSTAPMTMAGATAGKVPKKAARSSAGRHSVGRVRAALAAVSRGVIRPR